MKRFRFSLQALLTLRERAEQKALESYANALLQRRRAVEQLELIHRQQSEWWARRQNQMSLGCSAGTLRQWHACDDHLDEQRQGAEAELGRAEIAVNRTFQGMLLARRDRESVEKQMQRERRQHQVEFAREEQKALDDLGQRRGLPAEPVSRLQHSVA